MFLMVLYGLFLEMLKKEEYVFKMLGNRVIIFILENFLG